MLFDPSSPLVPARVGAPVGMRRLGIEPGSAMASAGPQGVGLSGTGPRAGAAALDDVAWIRWWQDLVIERHRVDRFDAFLPLPTESCPWELLVGLGRVVEESIAAGSGPRLATRLVVEALDAAGFGRVGDLEPDARRQALLRSGWGNDPWPGDDDLRRGVLACIADALLREIPPVVPAVDRRGDRPDPGSKSPLEAVILAATRRAVFAYAHHVEALARRSRAVAQSYQF